MTALFGISLLGGFVLMLVWLAATAVSASVDGWDHADPEQRFGRNGRFVLAGLMGFGMAGLSALFAGWSELLAVAAGIAGAAGLIGVSIWLGPDAER